jgi:hypothetical protein
MWDDLRKEARFEDVLNLGQLVFLSLEHSSGTKPTAYQFIPDRSSASCGEEKFRELPRYFHHQEVCV